MATYVIDFEATSEKYFMANPLQFCALKLDTSDLLNTELWSAQSYYFMVDKPIPPQVTAITGISNLNIGELSGGSYFEDLYDKFSYVFGNGNTIVGHNIKTYDMNLCKTVINRYGLRKMGNVNIVDTLSECKNYPWIHRCRNKKLGTVYNGLWEYYGIREEQGKAVADDIARKLGASDFEMRNHNALYDCIVNALVYSYGVEATK